MYSRQHRTSKSPGNDSDAPRTNQFAPRPFVVQPQTEEVKPQEDQTADLQTKAEKFKQVADGFPDPAIFTRHVTPPKRPRVQMKLNIARTQDKHEEEAIETQSLRESGELGADASNAGNKETIQRACSKCESKLEKENELTQVVQAQTITMQPSCSETARYPGNKEHQLIEQDYKQNINSNSAVEFSIPGSGPNGGIGYADIVDLGNHAIYEIKTYPGSAQGVVEAERYRRFAQKNCDPNAMWQIGTQYPKRVIPLDAQTELICQQYPQFPGVITYYSRKRKQEQKKEVYQEIVKLVKRVVETGEDVDTAVQSFLIEHPEVKNYLIAAAVGITIGTLVEDILTAGGGILDDPASLGVVWALIRAARAVP